MVNVCMYIVCVWMCVNVCGKERESKRWMVAVNEQKRISGTVLRVSTNG